MISPRPSAYPVHSTPPAGASCGRRPGRSLIRRGRLWKSCVRLIGTRSTPSSAAAAGPRRMRKISTRASSLACWTRTSSPPSILSGASCAPFCSPACATTWLMNLLKGMFSPNPQTQRHQTFHLTTAAALIKAALHVLCHFRLAPLKSFGHPPVSITIDPFSTTHGIGRALAGKPRLNGSRAICSVPPGGCGVESQLLTTGSF